MKKFTLFIFFLLICQISFAQGIDKRFSYVIYAENGYATMPEEEIKASVSCYLWLVEIHGYEKALKKSMAYTKKSKQYNLVSKNLLNEYEKKHYQKICKIIDSLKDSPEKRLPVDHHENVRQYGSPYWAKEMISYRDIGKQRYYTSKTLYKKLGRKI